MCLFVCRSVFPFVSLSAVNLLKFGTADVDAYFNLLETWHGHNNEEISNWSNEKRNGLYNKPRNS